MEITDASATKIGTESWGEFVEFPLVTVMSKYDEYNNADGDNPGARRKWMGPVGDIVENHCETVGRDPDEIESSWDGHVICTRDEAKLDRLLDLMVSIQFESEYTDQPDIETEEDAREYFVMGTPKSVWRPSRNGSRSA